MVDLAHGLIFALIRDPLSGEPPRGDIDHLARNIQRCAPGRLQRYSTTRVRQRGLQAGDRVVGSAA